MTSGIIDSVTFIYWGHSEDKYWKNAHTDEMLREMTYLDDNLRLPNRDNMKFIVANCNRNTEEYRIHKDTVERFRPKKTRLCPLVVIELKKPVNGTKEEYWVIENTGDHSMKECLKRIKTYLNTPYK